MLLHVKNFDTFTTSFYNGFFRLLESCLELRQPRELAVWAEKWLKGGHCVTQLSVAGDLIDKTEPTPDIHSVSWGGKISYGVEVLGQGFDGVV